MGDDGSANRPSPLAYFLTFTVHGTWLHGDERGSVDRWTNELGSPRLDPDPSRYRYEQYGSRAGVPLLTTLMRECVSTAIAAGCAHRGWALHAQNVRTNHVHLVVSGNEAPERIMTSLKAYATRDLVRANLVRPRARVWTRHGSTRYVWDEEALGVVVEYVLNGQGGLGLNGDSPK